MADFIRSLHFTSRAYILTHGFPHAADTQSINQYAIMQHWRLLAICQIKCNAKKPAVYNAPHGNPGSLKVVGLRFIAEHETLSFDLKHSF